MHLFVMLLLRYGKTGGNSGHQTSKSCVFRRMRPTSPRPPIIGSSAWTPLELEPRTPSIRPPLFNIPIPSASQSWMKIQREVNILRPIRPLVSSNHGAGTCLCLLSKPMSVAVGSSDSGDKQFGMKPCSGRCRSRNTACQMNPYRAVSPRSAHNQLATQSFRNEVLQQQKNLWIVIK